MKRALVQKRPRGASRTGYSWTECGFTLIELVVVVAIFVILAGLVMFKAEGILAGANGASSPSDITTKASLIAVREAIDGPPDQPGFLQDLRSIPAVLADLFRAPGLLLSGDAVLPFDPVTKRGWNGPYLLRATGTYHIDDVPVNGNGFKAIYGAEGDPCIVDARGFPIVLQVPPDADLAVRVAHARLVAAGADHKITTDPNMLAPDVHDEAQVGDDIVMFLFRTNGP